jgi:hypothetical protein
MIGAATNHSHHHQAFHGVAFVIIQSKGQAERSTWSEFEWLDLSDRGG